MTRTLAGGAGAEQEGRWEEATNQWAEAMAMGIPPDIYWGATPRELDALARAKARWIRARERAAVLRAGLVAAAVYNVHRRPGSRPVRPADFLPPEPRPAHELAAAFRAWAADHNASIADDASAVGGGGASL